MPVACTLSKSRIICWITEFLFSNLEWVGARRECEVEDTNLVTMFLDQGSGDVGNFSQCRHT